MKESGYPLKTVDSYGNIRCVYILYRTLDEKLGITRY